MRSRLTLFLILLLMIVGVGQVIAATITPTLTTVPKGAYVNGGGDQDNDNHYWQQVKVQFDTYHPNAGIFTLYLPDGMYLADIDGDGNLSEDIVVSYDDANALNNPFMVRYFSANGSKNELSFVYVTGDGTDLYPPRFPDSDMIAYLMFPIVTDLNPTVTNDDYRIAFGVPAAKITTLQIVNGEVASAGITVGSYLKGDNGDGDFTDGDEVLFVVQAIDVSGDPDLVQVVYTGADPAATHDVAVVTFPEQTFSAPPAVWANVTGAVGTGATDRMDVLPIGDGTAGAFTVGQYAAKNVTTAPVAIVIATAAGTGAEDSLYVLYSGAQWTFAGAATDNLDAIAAPGPYTGLNGVILANGSPSVFTGDNVAAGDGPSITYATDLQRLMGSLVNFTSHFYGNNDQTTTHGEKHPATDDVFLTALPNVAFDAGDGFHEFSPTVSPTNSSNLELGFDGVDNNGEVLYYVWALPDSLQTYVWPTMTGAQPVLFYATTLQPSTFENKTNGPVGTGLATSNLPEGSWYFYVTSNVTGRHVLARSDKVIVRHWPYVRMVGWDWNAGATPAFDGIADDEDVVLDSGNYYGYDPADPFNVAKPPRKTLDLYLKVDDYDSNAEIKVFYSTAANLDTTAIQTSGSPLQITGLTGATQLTSRVYYDDFDKDTDGFIKLTWNINPTGGPFIPAGDYTIYVVANDGVHQSISASKGADTSSQEKVTVKHSPNLNLDALTEYDLGNKLTAADVVVDPSQTDVLMLSWGKSGITGAQDIDNSAKITFYIDYDDGQDGPDYLHNQATALQTAAGTNNALPQGPHRIALNLEEDLESKDQMWFAWNFAKDFAETGWRPYDQSAFLPGTTSHYHIYAVIDEVTGDAPTKRVVILGGYTTPTEIAFDNKWFARLADPPVDGVTISADETLSLRYQAFDFDNIAQVGIFLVKNGVDILGTGENAPSTIKLYNIWANTTDGQAYCITDNNGWLAPDVATGDGSWLSESTYPSYSRFSFTPRLPSQDRKLSVISIPATAGFTVGGYVTAENGATGRIIDLVANTSLTVEYTGTNFSAAGGSSGVSPGQTYTAPGSTNITAVNGPRFGKYWYSMVNATNGSITSPTVYNSLNSGTYWPYIGIDDSTYYKQTLTTTVAAANFSVGNYVYTAGPTSIGRIIAKPAADQITVVYTGTAFANNDVLLETTDPSDPVANDTGDTYTVGAAGAGASVVSNNFTGWNITLHRAPGALTILNAEENAPQRNLMISPVSPVVTVGDTISYSVRAADEGNDVDLIDVYIAVEKAHFTLVNETTPFTDTSPTTLGNLISNRVIDDDANGRWILNATIFNSGAPINPANFDLGSELCTFKVISKGTTNAIGATTSIYYVNEPVKGWVTRFSNDDRQMFISMGASTVKMVPRAIIEGIVEFQGRAVSNLLVDFELRKRGSYVPSTDTHFISRNDADANAAGLQMALDTDGKFSLFQVPTGEWDLVVKYDRYLSKLTQVSIYPGLDTLFISYGILKGGDCYGYVDSTGAVWPNNVIDQDDIDRISTAYLATSAHAKWNNGADNWKWADINEDGIVYVEDLSQATGNYLTGPGTTGAQPVYQKPAVQPVASNLDAIVSLMNQPTDIKAGRTYTFQVVVQNAGDVRGYDVGVDYDTNIFSYAGIRKGDFINAQSYFFPVEGEGHIGFVNSVYGARSFSGDGMLMEVSLTANRDGVFSSDMVSLSDAVFVNSNYIKETILSTSETGLSTDAPTVFELSQNFPNPFNPTTTINFSVPQNGNVSLKIYDVLGRHVATLVDGSYSAGNYNLVWNATDVNGNLVSNGVYFYKLEAGSHRATKRMLFLK